MVLLLSFGLGSFLIIVFVIIVAVIVTVTKTDETPIPPFACPTCEGSINIDTNYTTPNLVFPSAGLIVTSMLQSSGKLVRFYTNPTDTINVIRYNVDGSLDTTFGTNGTTVLNNYNTVLDSMVTVDDKLLVLLRTLGPSNYDLIRLNQNGEIDPTFSIFNQDGVLKFTVLNDRIYVMGYTSIDTLDQLAIYVLSINGDLLFSRIFSRAPAEFFAFNGNISTYFEDIVVISSIRAPEDQYVLIRFDKDVNIVSSFGTDGVAPLGPRTGISTSIGVSQMDDTLVCSIYVFVPEIPSNLAQLCNVDGDGNLVSNFGTDGKVIIPFNIPTPGPYTTLLPQRPILILPSNDIFIINNMFDVITDFTLTEILVFNQKGEVKKRLILYEGEQNLLISGGYSYNKDCDVLCSFSESDGGPDIRYFAQKFTCVT